MEQRVQAVQPVEPQGGWWRIFAAMSDDEDFEYLIVDSTPFAPTSIRRGQKGGLKIKPLASPAAA